jgi:hypothetical protein
MLGRPEKTTADRRVDVLARRLALGALAAGLAIAASGVTP